MFATQTIIGINPFLASGKANSYLIQASRQQYLSQLMKAWLEDDLPMSIESIFSKPIPTLVCILLSSHLDRSVHEVVSHHSRWVSIPTDLGSLDRVSDLQSLLLRQFNL